MLESVRQNSRSAIVYILFGVIIAAFSVVFGFAMIWHIWWMAIAGFVGMIAMLWVGGGILVHGLHELGVHGPEKAVHHTAEAFAALLPSLHGLLVWLGQAGIAAVLANAGIQVYLLDIVPKKGGRNSLAEGAIEKQLKGGTPGFAHKKFAKLVTPGIASSSRLMRSVDRRLASTEAPGRSIQCIRKSRSSKSGRNSSPKNGRHRTPRIAVNTVSASATRGLRSSGVSSARYPACSHFTTRGSWVCVSKVRGSSHSDNTGVTVSATSSEVRIDRT